jgi:hypothetical protein
LLVESVQDAVLNGHKVLVFTNFLAAVELLAADFEQRGIGHLTMTGATANRETLVRQFQICGSDCSTEPRFQDPQGRYYHQRCYPSPLA